VFSGPAGDVDPLDTGLIQALDTTHTTQKGEEVLAELVRELGYAEEPCGKELQTALAAGRFERKVTAQGEGTP
jgi:hypothetical protein